MQNSSHTKPSQISTRKHSCGENIRDKAPRVVLINLGEPHKDVAQDVLQIRPTKSVTITLEQKRPSTQLDDLEASWQQMKGSFQERKHSQQSRKLTEKWEFYREKRSQSNSGLHHTEVKMKKSLLSPYKLVNLASPLKKPPESNSKVFNRLTERQSLPSLKAELKPRTGSILFNVRKTSYNTKPAVFKSPTKRFSVSNSTPLKAPTSTLKKSSVKVSASKNLSGVKPGQTKTKIVPRTVKVELVPRVESAHRKNACQLFSSKSNDRL